MKYKLQIYCKVPTLHEREQAIKRAWNLGKTTDFWAREMILPISYLPLLELKKETEQMKREITRQDLVIDGYREISFENWEELAYHVRCADYLRKEITGRKMRNIRDLREFAHVPNAIGNNILNATMTHPNDSLRHEVEFNISHWYFSWEHRIGKGRLFYFLGYLVKDENGRTLDLRNYTEELYKFNFEEYQRRLDRENWKHREERRQKRVCEFEKTQERQIKLLLLGQRYNKGRYANFYIILNYRNIKTFSETRANTIDEHKPYIRGKRRNLPNTWAGGRISRYREKSWKLDRKAKRQWQINLPK